jgi:tetratricopeptide (TPR) repeat protein
MNNLRLEKLKDMERQKPADAFIKFAIAQEYAGIGNDTDARLYLELLVDKFPDYVPAYYQLGKLYERMMEPVPAQRIYAAGIEKARAVNDLKTAGELNEALMLLNDE